MATRQPLIVWIPVVLVAVLTVGYVEWRMSRAAEIAPARELVGAASKGANARGSNIDGRAFALAATANARAERAEQTLVELEERLGRQDAIDGVGDSPESSESTEEKRERERAEREEFLDELDERFTTEPVDPAWRREKESALQSAGAVLNDFGVTLETAECASSMCRVRLAHPSRERLPRDGIIEFLKSVHGKDSPLTQLAFNFKYEEGATVLYGTTKESSAEATQEQ